MTTMNYNTYRISKGKGYRVFYTGIPIPRKRSGKDNTRMTTDEEFLKQLPIGGSFWNHKGYGYFNQLSFTLGIKLTERTMPNGKIMTWRIA